MAVLGGTCTLIGNTTNLLVDGVPQASGIEPLSIFEIIPVGLVAAATGGLALLMLGSFLLPDRGDIARLGADNETAFFTELRPWEDYLGVGQRMGGIFDLNRRGMEIIGVRSRSGVKRDRLNEHVLEPSDKIIAKVTTSELLTLRRIESSEVSLRQGPVPETVTDLIVAEAIVTLSRRSRGVRICPARYGMRVIGAHRHGETIGPDLSTALLRPADTLLLEGTLEGFAQMTEAGDLAAITDAGGRAFRREKAPLALLARCVVVVLAAARIAEVSVLALIAIATILVLRCIDSNEAWSSIDAGVLVLIFSMLIVEIGLQNSGAVGLIVKSVTPALDGMPPIVTLAAVYLLSSVLTEAVTNNAVAVVVTPFAIGLAE
ncbi:SLC13 family permease [uncultured Ruegeria sp.]|uniref:SLC13 family permease n=1 Tax=uncultured Ruegeria sp. TaxID=259304 RepID=UPI00261F2A59|nr:SLC13 family permease [uncultured Ruegeria sp.]